MKKTKIFVDCHVFDGNFQGTTTYIKGLYSELIKDTMHHIFLGASNIENLKNIFGTHENVTFIKYKTKNKFYRLLFDIPAIIKENEIDYAHFQYVVPLIKACKYIVTIHDVLFLDFPEYFPLFYRIKNKFLFKKSAERADVVLSVSEYSKTQIQKHFKTQKVVVTPNAVDPIYFEKYDKTQVQKQVEIKFKVKKYFLFVSRWEPRKNHHRLLKVFVEKEYYKDHLLVFIGDKAIVNKEYNIYYRSLPENIKTKVLSFNKVNFEDLILFVRGADLSIYPSIAEGFGIPPLESMACEVPTVCSNSTAMADFDFIGDCLFNPLSTEDLNDKIRFALSLSNDLSVKREKLLKKYNWNFSAQQLSRAVQEFKEKNK